MHETRRSLHLADAVLVSPYQKPLLDRLFPGKELCFLPHCLHLPESAQLPRARAEARADVCGSIGAADYFFSCTRHCWRGVYARRLSDYKGNELVLGAFAEFVDCSRARGVKLVLVEKGRDVEASKLHASELGIADRVAWVPEMRRTDLSRYYLGARLCLGQFGTPVITYSAVEPLAYGTPCCSWFGTPSEEVPRYATPPPLINVQTPEGIAQTMLSVTRGDQEYERLSRESHRWALENCSESAFVKAFVSMF